MLDRELLVSFKSEDKLAKARIEKFELDEGFQPHHPPFIPRDDPARETDRGRAASLQSASARRRGAEPAGFPDPKVKQR